MTSMTNHMKKYFFLFLCLWTIPLLGQNQARIDSLMTQLNQVEGKDLVDVQNALSEEYQALKYKEALRFGKEALSLAKKIKYQEGMGLAYRNVGIAYILLDQHIDALKYLFQALGIEEKLGNEYNRALCLDLIGQAYKKRDIYDQAIKYYVRAVEAFEKLELKEGTVNALNGIADAYFSLAEYNSSVDYAYKSIAIATEIKYEKGIKDASFIISEVYSRVGNYRRAYQYHQLYTEKKDSLTRHEQIEQVEKMEADFARERQAMQEAALEKEARIRQVNLQYLLILVIFIALFISIFFFGRFSLSSQFVKSFIFVSLFLVAQFILLLIRPTIENATGGMPLFMLLSNAAFALIFLLVSRRIEGRLKKRVVVKVMEREKAMMKQKLENTETERDKDTEEMAQKQREASQGNSSKVDKLINLFF